jgi:hypothetical protein
MGHQEKISRLEELVVDGIVVNELENRTSLLSVLWVVPADEGAELRD